MRKFVLALAALAVVAGAAVYAVACDKSNSKTSGAQASACPGMKGAASAGACAGKAGTAALAGAECPMHKGDAAKAGAGCDAAAKAACEKGKMAAGEDCCAKGGAGCVDHVFSVVDMHGECCVVKVEQALSGVKGVKAVFVDLEASKAYVCTGSKKVDSKAAIKSLHKAGYKEVSYTGTDSEHCVDKMKAAREKEDQEKNKDAGKV